MLFKSKIFMMCQTRWSSSRAKPKLLETFNTLLENNEAKHRKHPGIIPKNAINLPKPILEAMKIILEDFPNKADLYAECIQFKNHLNGRHAPLEENEKRGMYEASHQKLMKKQNVSSHEELELLRKRNEPKVSRLVKQQVNMWQEINYNDHKSLLYMLGRGLQNYAVLYTILNEILHRDKKFSPKTVLDFGSGIGTTMWAINELWPQRVKEFVNVDVSNEINNLSERIINILYPKFTGTFYRQFMPMSLRPNYDITMCAYSLIELPNAKSRLDVVMKLWKKTTNYLVIVEEGTSAGFQLVSEAREFILHLSDLSTREKKSESKSEETHVFAPCPHDLACPKRTQNLKLCSFVIGYISLPLLGNSATRNEYYSYVVLKKGVKSKPDSSWPRLISPVLKRGKHVICRMCNSSGNLEENIFTRSRHGRNLYRCARMCKWGDRLPIEFESVTSIDSDSTSENEESNNVNVPENKDKNITEYEDVIDK